MFIKSRNEYLISENLKQARQYLNNKSIPLDSPEFLHIIKLLKSAPNLIDTFTRMFFEEDNYSADINNTKLNEFDRVITWINNNKNITNQLPKNLIKYKSIEELSDDISTLQRNRKVNTFTKSLYKSMRDDIDKLSDIDKSRFYDLALAFMNLGDNYKSMFTPLQHFQVNNISIQEFMDIIDKFISNGNVNESKNKIYNYIKSNENVIDIIYDNDDILAIQTNDGGAISELGAEKWCIVYSPDIYQYRYIGEHTKNTQYIIFNFNLPSSSRYSIFGVTIDVSGNCVSGGSQDRLNNYVDISEIYKLTGMPEDLLVSLHKEEYDELMKMRKTISERSTYEEIKKFRKLSIDLNKQTYSEMIIEPWVSGYINAIDLSVDHNILYNTIEDVENKLAELSFDADELMDPIKNKYIDTVCREINFKEIKSFNRLLTLIKPFVSKLKNANMSFTHLISATHNWVVDNVSNVNGKELIDVFKGLIDTFIYSDYNHILTKYLGSLKLRDIKDSIVKEITKDYKTMLYYFMNDITFVYIIDFNFIRVMENLRWATLDKCIVLLYLRDFSRYSTVVHNFIDYDRISYTNIPSTLITAANIIELKNNSSAITKLLTNKVYNDYKVRTDDYIDISLEYLIGDLVSLILYNNINSDTIPFNEVKLVYDNLKEYIEPTHWDMNAISLIMKYSNEFKEVADFIGERKKMNEFSLSSLFSFDIIKSDMKIDEEYMENVGRLYLHITPDNEIGQVEENNLLIYCASLIDSKYLDVFNQNIGLTLDKKTSEWYLDIEYETLGNYFDRYFDFTVKFNDHHISYTNDEVSIYSVDFTNIRNLSIICEYLSKHGHKINMSIFDKYNMDSESIVSVYENDTDLVELIKYIDGIIFNSMESYINDIRNYLNSSYNREYNKAFTEKYFNINLTIVGSAIFKKWRDSSGTVGDSYYIPINDSVVRVIPDLSKLILSNTDVIAYLDGITNIDIYDVIRAYFDSSGNLRQAYDGGYITLDTENYIRVNKDLFELLNLKITSDSVNESSHIITNLSQFIKKKNE